MPIKRSQERNTTHRYRNEQDSSLSLSADPIILKGGHSLNFISQWFFLWVIPLLRRSRSDPDFDPDSIELQQAESAHYAGERLGDKWRQEELDFKENSTNAAEPACVPGPGTG
ncbi:hypothetical protein FBU30_000832 [Linnemannia zychae]|nr:hypothetical protein FBU30_000832 [Linnemannia zychae]